MNCTLWQLIYSHIYFYYDSKQIFNVKTDKKKLMPKNYIKKTGTFKQILVKSIFSIQLNDVKMKIMRDLKVM